MAEEKIRIGIIGASAHYGWSMRAHLPALSALPEYELTAVGTSRRETAEESAKRYGARLAFHDYERDGQAPGHRRDCGIRSCSSPPCYGDGRPGSGEARLLRVAPGSEPGGGGGNGRPGSVQGVYIT